MKSIDRAINIVEEKIVQSGSKSTEELQTNFMSVLAVEFLICFWSKFHFHSNSD